MKVDMAKAAGWLGTALETGTQIMKGANFTLKEMIRRCASRLDVRESDITVTFGKSDGQWRWCAELADDGKAFCAAGKLAVYAEDPMQALGQLVDKAEE